VRGEERLDIFQLRRLVPDILPLVLLHLLANFLNNETEIRRLVLALVETFPEFIGVFSRQLDLFDVYVEQLLEIAVIGVHRHVVLGLVGQKGFGFSFLLNFLFLLGLLVVVDWHA